MKGKIPKILGVGLALVLVLSMSLVTAVPVGAEDGPLGPPDAVVFPFELGGKGEGNYVAEWEYTEVNQGSSSVHLQTTGTVGKGDEARILIDFSGMPEGEELTLGDIETISWYEYLIAGYPPHLDIRVDIDGNGTADDALVFEYAYNFESHCGETWPTYGALTGSWYETFSDDGDGPAEINDSANAWLASGPPGPLGDENFIYGTLAEWKAGDVVGGGAINADTVILAFEIEVDNWIVQSEAYVDDITINGTLIAGQIQDAIDSVSGESPFIYVMPGTYNEQVVVNKANLTLLGAQANVDPTAEGARTDPSQESIISGSGLTLSGNDDGIVRIVNDSIAFNGFTIKGYEGADPYNRMGIYLDNSSSCSISCNIISDIDTFGGYAVGIGLYGASSTNAFASNRISTIGKLSSWDGHVDKGSSFLAVGICLKGTASSNTFTNNQISDLVANSTALGIWFTEGTALANNIFTDTTIENVGKESGIPPGIWAAGISLETNARENQFVDTTIANVRFQSTAYGIAFYSASGNIDNTFENTNISDIVSTDGKATGISVRDPNTFTETDIAGITGFVSAKGVRIAGDSITFSGGEISAIVCAAESRGFSVEDSNHVAIDSFDITGASSGTFVGGTSTDVKVNHCNIHDNSEYGVFNEATEEVDATSNWWGDASGPEQTTTNPEAIGDEVSVKVVYSPWLGDTIETSPMAFIVDDLGPEPDAGYIQTAINAANPAGGDTVKVAAGIYTEASVVDKQVSLQGAGSASTIIDASGASADYGILLTAGGTSASQRLTIKGLTIKNSPSHGIKAYKSGGLNLDYVTFEDLVLTLNGVRGMEIHNDVTVHDMEITRCEFVNNDAQGLRTGSNVVVDGLVIADSKFNGNSYGIYLQGTINGVTILRSEFNNSVGGHGGYMTETGPLTNLVIEDSEFNDNAHGLQIWNVQDNADIIIRRTSFQDNDKCGVTIWGATLTDVLIEESTVLNNGGSGEGFYGIEFCTYDDPMTNVAVHFTSITGNTVGGVKNHNTEVTAIVDATSNWWGTAIKSQIADLVSDNVDYSPWLNAPYPNIESTSLDVTTISLVEGWNLISLPLVPTDSNIDPVLAGADLSVDQVAYYTGGPEPWLYYNTTEPPGTSDLTQMEDGKGYWIEVSTAGTLTISGYELCAPPPAVPPSYDLVIGWNLIGFKSLATDTAVTTYLGTAVTETMEAMYGYDAAAGFYTIIKSADNLVPGDGYWLAVSAKGTIYP